MIPRLIYDVGMHRGEDTDYYLKRGHRVIGIEANPSLVIELRARFQAELRSGQLQMIDKAINSQPGVARFAINEHHSIWGTLNDDFVNRNASLGAPSTFVEIECVTFDEILREKGMPYYLKVDIEGCDLLCLQALVEFEERPRYVSVESVATSPLRGIRNTLAEIRLLRSLGYNRFKYVDQSLIPNSTRHLSLEGLPITFTFPEESSGPFGDEAPGRWCSFAIASLIGMKLLVVDDFWGHGGKIERVAGARVAQKIRRGHSSRWYDLHAAIH
jgi:FkbM family methyltransferase